MKYFFKYGIFLEMSKIRQCQEYGTDVIMSRIKLLQKIETQLIVTMDWNMKYLYEIWNKFPITSPPLLNNMSTKGTILMGEATMASVKKRWGASHEDVKRCSCLRWMVLVVLVQLWSFSQPLWVWGSIWWKGNPSRHFVNFDFIFYWVATQSLNA